MRRVSILAVVVMVAAACSSVAEVAAEDPTTSVPDEVVVSTTQAPTTTEVEYEATTVAPETSVVATTTIGDEPIDDFVYPPLPVSAAFVDSGPYAEPFPFDAAAADCGFETIYGPTVVSCAVVDGADTPSPFAVLVHDLGARTVGFITCGDAVDQFPIMTGDEVYESGTWGTAEQGDDPAAFVLIGLEENWSQVVIVSSDAGIGEDGCPIAYDVGEWQGEVLVGGQHGALRIEAEGERSCVVKVGPGEFQLSDPEGADLAC